MAPTKRSNDLQKIALKKFTIVKLFAFSTHCFHSITSKQYFTVSDCFTLYFTLCSPLYFTLYFTLLLPSATKLRRLCFYRCLSVHRGCLPQCILGYSPPDRDPPNRDHPLWTETTPLWTETTPGQTLPLDRDPIPLDRDPPPIPQTATAPADDYCCGRYASYWKAFLLYISCSVSCSVPHSTSYFHVLCHAVFYVLFYALFHVLFYVLFHAVFQVHHVTPGQQISAKTGDFVAVYKAQTGSAKLWIRTHESEYCECTHTCTHAHTQTQNPRV